MANHKVLDVEAVRAEYTYNPAGGLWHKNSDKVPAAYILPVGYAYAYVGKRFITVQRLVWALHHGDPGQQDIDHINGNKLDNRIENLRAVSRTENNQNRRTAQINNKTSGINGVYFDASRGKWAASLNLNGRKVFFERYDTKEAAIAGRQWAEKTYFTHKT